MLILCRLASYLVFACHTGCACRPLWTDVQLRIATVTRFRPLCIQIREHIKNHIDSNNNSCTLFAVSADICIVK